MLLHKLLAVHFDFLLQVIYRFLLLSAQCTLLLGAAAFVLAGLRGGSRTLFLFQLVHSCHHCSNFGVFVLLSTTHSFCLERGLPCNNLVLQIFQLCTFFLADSCALCLFLFLLFFWFLFCSFFL